MHRLLILALLMVLAPVLAQDAGTEDDAASDAPVAEDAEAEPTADELYEDDFELDLGTSDDLDEDLDVFEASVEVSYQQSVLFPTDI